MNDLKQQLKDKLKELFQLDKQDLDFGIYRIMNYKSKEIEKFIEEDLIKGIKKELQLISEEGRKSIENRLKEISSKNEIKRYLEALQRFDKDEVKTLKKYFGESIKEYENLKKRLDEKLIPEDLERQIYNHLINFFSRYYDNGDFISKRRYGKNEKYIVPYNGEEILLYWANKDQYYIKTTEYFKKYTFKAKGVLRVNFYVIKAEEEKGNIKSTEKKFFVLAKVKNVFEFNNKDKVLDIYFEYRALTAEEKEKYKSGNSISQDKINKEIIFILQKKIPQSTLARVIFDKEGEKTLIEKHLLRYTRRNTTDFFIHKDLKAFLEREMDFYVKNEFLDLGDLQILEQSDYFDKLKLYIIAVRAFRKIAIKIIDFLAQIENFQKKLWEKKKFIIDTHYVITLDKIKEFAGEEFLESILDEILNNAKQVSEWKELFDIEVKTKDDLLETNGEIEFDGKKWKKLPIDTKYFSEDFKWSLLVAVSQNNNLDEILDGILIKSENFHALNLLLNKYKAKVQTIYIDPPFNKESEADYLYKVGYKDATWITMLENRINVAKELLNAKGNIFVRCDYNGNMYVRLLMNEIFGKDNFRNEIIIKRGAPKAGLLTQFDGIKSITVAYDNLYWYSKNPDIRIRGFFKSAPKEKQERGFWADFKKGEFYDRPTMRYEILGIKIDKGQWKWSKERAYRAVKNYQKYLEIMKQTNESLEEYWLRTGKKLEFIKKEKNKIKYWVPPREKLMIDNNWFDISGYASTTGFQTENSEFLLKRVIESTSNEGDYILDFFLGSGTTIATAQKLKRKWLGIEMGEHFYTVVLPRMKKVLFYDKSGISKEKEVKKKYNERTAGGFFKYHTLEQYEDALENIEFDDTLGTKARELFPDYIFYMLNWETKHSNTFLNIKKLENPFTAKLKVLENYQQKVVNIDLIETFNYLLGIKINKYKVEIDNNRKYVFVFGQKNGNDVVIVWRNTQNINLERDKQIIYKYIDSNIDKIYINSDSYIKNSELIINYFKLF